MDMLDNLLTVPEVASKLKVTPQYVRRLISENKLMASRIGSQWVITPSDLSTYIREYDVLIGRNPKTRKNPSRKKS